MCTAGLKGQIWCARPGGCEPVSRETAASLRRTLLVLIRPADVTSTLVGSILARGNGMLRPPPGEVPSRPFPSDEYDARVPRAFRCEEQKSSCTWLHAPSVGVRRGTVKQVALLLHVDGECAASASANEVDHAAGIVESCLCSRYTKAMARSGFT